MSYSPKIREAVRAVELRTGTPYANLIADQTRFASTVGEYFDVNSSDILPTTGATGAIEAARNHVFRLSRRAAPTLLTVCPGYWRARESFEGFGFRVTGIQTQPDPFSIREDVLVEQARKIGPDLVYLSLPNNPTGAVFDPELVIANVPDSTGIVLDLTLPSRELDTRLLTGALYKKFKGRRNLFLVGSTSKSHGTAELRVGWIVCAHSDDAAALRQENRNVVACGAIEQVLVRLGSASTVLSLIDDSFALLKDGEKHGRYHLVTPERSAKTGYVLIRSPVAPDQLRRLFDEERIRVMWGSEFGLANHYVRLETLEPPNIKVFVDAINPCAPTQTD